MRDLVFGLEEIHSSVQNEQLFKQLDELNELDRIIHALIRFPVIHNIDNVVNFVFLRSEG